MSPFGSSAVAFRESSSCPPPFYGDGSREELPVRGDLFPYTPFVRHVEARKTVEEVSQPIEKVRREITTMKELDDLLEENMEESEGFLKSSSGIKTDLFIDDKTEKTRKALSSIMEGVFKEIDKFDYPKIISLDMEKKESVGAYSPSQYIPAIRLKVISLIFNFLEEKGVKTSIQSKVLLQKLSVSKMGSPNMISCIEQDLSSLKESEDLILRFIVELRKKNYSFLSAGLDKFKSLSFNDLYVNIAIELSGYIVFYKELFLDALDETVSN